MNNLMKAAVLAAATFTTALPAVADHRNTNVTTPRAAFEQTVRDYGAQVGAGARATYNKYRDKANKYRDKALDAAKKLAVENGAKQLVTGIAKRTAVGIAVDLAWPERAE